MPKASVQEAEEPERDVLLAADFEVADGAVADTRLAWRGSTSVHIVLAIDDEHCTTIGGVDLVVARASM